MKSIKNLRIHLIMLFAFLITLSSCSVIESIFKAGVWSGVIIVVLVIALIVFLIGKMGGGNK